MNLSELRDPIDGTRLNSGSNALYNSNNHEYPIVSGIPRFVSSNNYAASFGNQWNQFRRTQLDSYSGVTLSESRLRRCFGEDLSCLNGKRVLEAGSGAGRFTEILLKYGAIVHSFDYSTAVEANMKNNGHSPSLLLVQADIQNIPFQPHSYDFVVCLGVLQHTPDTLTSLKSLWKMVAPGGSLIVDHYEFRLLSFLPPPVGQALDLYRLFILMLPYSSRFNVIRNLVRFWFPIHWYFRNSRVAQALLRRLSPVIFHYPDIPLRTRSDYFQWALLDTHDSTTDIYKRLLSLRQLNYMIQALEPCRSHLQKGGNGLEARITKWS